MITIPLTRGQVAVVDDVDADLVARRWYAIFNGWTHYAARRNEEGPRNAPHPYLHRRILERVLGRCLVRGEQVDHIDGNGLNNRRENLRLATSSDNNHNKGKARRNTSGFKGVYRDNRRVGWFATVQLKDKSTYLGSFPTPEQAAIAYDFAAALLHGEFARLNFPLEVTP